MTNSLNKTIRTSVLALAAFAASQLALHAIPITGKVEMQGTIGLNATTLGGASGTVVDNDPGDFEAYTVAATSTGAYAGVTDHTGVEWKAFSWNPISPLPISALWSFTHGGLNYSFDLSSFSVVTHSSNFLDIAGSGTLKIQGPGSIYDDTVGVWGLQILATGQNTNAQFIFQSSNSTPDGGTTAVLIGLGLVTLSLVSRRRLAKA